MRWTHWESMYWTCESILRLDWNRTPSNLLQFSCSIFSTIPRPILATFDNKPLILHCCPLPDKKEQIHFTMKVGMFNWINLDKRITWLTMSNAFVIDQCNCSYLQTSPCRPWHSLCFRLASIFASFTSSLKKCTQHVTRKYFVHSKRRHTIRIPALYHHISKLFYATQTTPLKTSNFLR